MNYYEYIFVVLIYRNIDDLYKFNQNLEKAMDKSYHVVTVESFYSENVSEAVRLYSESMGFDYISVENKGYGYGNNVGIAYALEKYQFKYLIVCNSDIEIQKFDLQSITVPAVIAPIIVTNSGKKQNPFWARRNRIGEWFIYQGHKHKSKNLLNIGQAMNKVIREIFLLWFGFSRKSYARIYAAHGSFIIFHKEVISQMHPIFTPEMFLFYEEAYIANALRKKGIPVFLSKQVSVHHFEDGSTKGSNLNLSSYARKSYIYYYENQS